MRLLLTSDWQSDSHNLHKCEIVRDELIAHARQYKPDAIVHCGDLKQTYNPIDGHVLNFWTKTTKLLAAICPFYINLGNHDNFSQSIDTDNWLGALRAHGARLASRGPAIYQVGDGHIAMLPFTKDKQREQQWADSLAEDLRIKQGPCVLIFHGEQYGASLGGKRTWQKATTDLHADQYLYAFGGHFHEHGSIPGTNIVYVGSPFCQDWGEVNQPKGHVLFDSLGLKGSAEFPPDYVQLETKGVPGWYDSWYLKKNNDIWPEPGAYIRRKVLVTSRHFTRQVHEAENKLRKLYGDDKQYLVIPKFVNEAVSGLKLNAATDAEQVADYLQATLPEAFKVPIKQVQAYMLSKLGQTRQVLPGSELRFLSAYAKNFLVFPEIKVNFQNKGLVLVTGINKDWEQGTSNGAGKSSLLSLLPVALCGQTTKKQRNNAWAHERNKRPAVVGLRLLDSLGRKVTIRRQARPFTLTLTIDEKDKTSGMRGTSKEGTQGDIEKLVGMDYRMLMNSVYFDQTIANSFVHGAQSARMDLISKLQNLERFDIALAAVKVDLNDCVRSTLALSVGVERNKQLLESFEAQVKLLKEQEVNDYTEKVAKLKASLNVVLRRSQKLLEAESTYAAMQVDADAIASQLAKAISDHTEAFAAIKSLQDANYRTEQLRRKGKCGTCGQDTTGIQPPISTKQWADADQQVNRLAQTRKTLEKKLNDLNSEIGSYDSQCAAYKSELERTEHDIQVYSSMAESEEKANASLQTKRGQLHVKASHISKLLANDKKQLDDEYLKLEMYEFAKKAFSRHGLPMYLSAALCPVLNNAAEEYSEIFTDDKIKLTFEIVDEEFIVRLINTAGSTKTAGQSMGESALAGIVAAFALRSVAPKTNLLVLDEPGSHLDPVSARRFAEGLLKLKSRFETILVCSHNQAITSALSSETTWCVTKRNGASVLDEI